MKNLIILGTTYLPRGSVVVTLSSVAYLLLMWILIGIRIEHWCIVLIINILFYAGNGPRRFVMGFAIFILFAILYDVMRAFPNYMYHSVDIASLYHLEKSLFGINVHGVRLTPNEFFAVNHGKVGDILSGLFYINWIPIPLAFAIYLYFTSRKLFLHFSLTFLLVNLIGFCIYYIHPAAPPWYVNQYGFSFIQHTPGSAAGLARFDNLIHLNVFGSIYSKNSNVFAAIPSLHCAYPVVVLYYSIKARCGDGIYFFGIFMMGIWFAAIYSGHHYTIDVIVGILCALMAIVFYELILKDQRFYCKFVNRYYKLISRFPNTL
jgi:inositol phosphorylceramide synthase catalytic subunit